MTQVATAKENPPRMLAGSGYLHRATLPFPSLVLLLPLIILYEVGTRYFTTAAAQGMDQQIIAFSQMRAFFLWFGANGRHMPAMAVVGILLAWHIARNDPWRTELHTLAGMLVESVILSLPLLLLAFVVNRYFPDIGLQSESGGSLLSPTTQDRLIMDLGAGVYEEFVFRFVLFTVLSLLLKDILRFNRLVAYPLMVVISGVGFSLYHYLSPSEHFAMRIFAFRALAGMYFGLIFIWRGFGITAVGHAAYDIIITLGLS